MPRAPAALRGLQWIEPSVFERPAVSSPRSAGRRDEWIGPSGQGPISLDGRARIMVAFLERNEVPRWQGAKSAKDEAVGLLRAAAEIEHALLVQYLYAGLSIASDETRFFMPDDGSGDPPSLIFTAIARASRFISGARSSWSARTVRS